MSLLPKFDVVVWIMKTDAFPALRDELIGLAADEPDESTEYEGMVDFHWRFDSFAEAESVAAAFTVLRQKPEVVFLRLSNCDDAESVVHVQGRTAWSRGRDLFRSTCICSAIPVDSHWRIRTRPKARALVSAQRRGRMEFVDSAAGARGISMGGNRACRRSREKTWWIYSTVARLNGAGARKG